MTRTTSTTNFALLHLLVLLSPWSFASFVAEASSAPTATTAKSPFKIIFDGGSTGSRLHIFEFVEVNGEDENDRKNGGGNNKDGPMIWPPSSNIGNEVQCVRRGSSRADIPLSAFGRMPSEQNIHNPLDSSEVAAHLLPLFDYAANIIPPHYYETTGVYYQATAGMRLLEESEQEAVYDAVFEGLMTDESFVFRGIQRKDIATLSGEMEAYYGALAANFLQGIIDTELRVLSAQNNSKGMGELPDHPVGALDMGGSSTQIVYIANHDEEDNKDEEMELLGSLNTCPIKQKPQSNGDDSENQNTCRLSDEHFFSTSYLSYGVDQIRNRLWDTLVVEYIALEPDDTCDAHLVPNPCANKGFEVEHNGYTLIGTGNTKECIRQMKRLIPHPEILHDLDSDVSDWVVGGVEHPPIRGKFLAMSLYFFSLDSLRVFSKPDEKAHLALDQAWPNPSIDELQNALYGLCSRNWQGDMELQEGVHSFTRKEVLPHRCLETVYMVTLLKDGFGFHPSSRDITFTFLIDGDEVEWTLGLALAMNANELSSTPTTTVTTTAYDYSNEEVKDDRCNETGNNIFEEEQRYHMQGMPNSQYFAVTMPPTHCC